MNASKKNWYLTQFDLFDKNINGKKNTPAGVLREKARQLFAELDFPTTDHESWKYTNLAPVMQYNFTPAVRPDPAPIDPSLMEPLFIENTYRMVFVNGWFHENLSSLKNLPRKAAIRSLADAFRSDADLLTGYLGTQSLSQPTVFPAVNLSMLNDGALIHIPDGVEIDQPVHLIFYTSAGGRCLIHQPITLIIAGRDAKADIIVHSIGQPGETYLTNAMTEIYAGASSEVQIANVQCESPQAYHINSIYTTQSADSLLGNHAFSFGSSLARNDISAVLGGENSECVLNGLFTVDGQQHSDHSTVIDHAAPNCRSREVYKGILGGKSTGAFSGKIIVRPDSQRTDAKQSNNNLLLTKDATMNTRPQLEIFADDVKCTHGATIGRIDDTALFYMRSRGIDLFRAQSILTMAFAMQLVEDLPWETLRLQLEERIASHFNFKN